MTSSPLQQPREASPRWIAEHTRRWVDAGVLTREQAAAIVRLETGSAPAEAPGLSLVAEVLAYLGSLLALVGGAVVVTRTWDQLGVARVVIGVIVAAVAFLAGREIDLMAGEAAQRVCGFLWLIGAGGAALAVGTAGYELGLAPAWVALVVGLVLVGIGAPLWRNRRDRPLQLVTLLAGAGTSVVAIGKLLELDISPWILGLGLWVLSLIVGAITLRGHIHPATWMLAIAGAGLIGGAAMLGDLAINLGAGAALVSAGGVVAVGLWQRRVPVTVIGVIGFFESLMAVLNTFLRGAGSLVVLVAGVAMVVVVIVRAMHHPPPVGPTT